MKKIFTLTMLALLTVGSVNAQGLRKTWDFRNGFSTKTVNALKADQEEHGDNKYWRNYESDATKSDEQHFWCASKDAKNSDGYASTHNGGVEKVIEELDGLKLGFAAAKKFVITYDGAQAANEFESEGGPALGEMIPHGKSYVWLNGKNETISFQAEVGQTIKIAVESHAVNKAKLGEARGISLSATGGTLTAKFEGNPVPTYYTEYEWDLTGDPGAVADLTIKSTNGCHIYYIIVGEGDDPNANKTKVSYLTAGDATQEDAYQKLAASDKFVVTAVDAATVTADALKANTVTVVSPALPADHAAVSVLKEAMTFTPILNLNANLYAAWGYGEKATGEPFAVIKNLKSEMFADFVLEQDYIETDGLNGMVFETAQLTGVKPGDFFKGDDSLSVDVSGNVVYIHTHNPYHNAYVYLPQESMSSSKLVVNAIDMLKSSKTEVTQVSAPKIKLEYKNLNTNITLSMAASNLPKPHIYYTLDGTDPTTASTQYTDVINVTSACTVKAVAIAEGYTLSDVASAAVEIFTQPATPTIGKNYEDGKTTVTLACATEGVDIWYNYNETVDTTKSMKYAEPFVITAPANITVFSVAGKQVFSELTTERVLVKNAIVRQDVVAHFDANATDWQQGGSGSTVYYFSWGKNAASIYDTTKDPVSTTTDPDTGDEIKVYPEKDYEVYVPESEANAWKVMSKGQVMIWQSLTVGKDPGNDSGYNPETTGDIISYANISSNDIQFGGKVSGEACTGALQSLGKFTGPFDIVTYVGTAAGGDNVGRMQLQVSVDGSTWTNVGDEMTTSIVKRLWKGYVRGYEGTDEVYVRLIQAGGGASVQIYDIYVMNTGENSLTLKAQYDAEWEASGTGIQTISDQKVKAATGIYNINGIRQQSLRRGLNIVVMGDGSVRKVMVK